jgi:hypothetical protein
MLMLIAGLHVDMVYEHSFKNLRDDPPIFIESITKQSAENNCDQDSGKRVLTHFPRMGHVNITGLERYKVG